MTLHFFTFFPAIYSTYNGLARKNRPGFSHVRVCGLGQTNFPPIIYAYIQSRRRCANKQDRRGGSNRLRAYLVYGEYKTRLKLAQMARHGYDAICTHSLFTVYHIDRFPSRQPHIIWRWKNVWMYTNLLWKNVMSEWIFIWKMWMMLTLILI